MKLLSVLFILGCATFWGQGNLQFNQVKLITSVETVPAGKTWKISGFLASPNGNYQSITQPSTAEYLISINGSPVNLGRRAHFNNNYQVHQAEVRTTEEFWIPAGTTLAASQNIAFISIIEFNIIP